MENYRILIADDHPHARLAIIEMLEGDSLFSIVGQATNGKEAIEFCEKLLPDILLIDINMPLLNGLEATKIIKGKFPYIKVIILSVSDHIEDLFTAIQYGAQGYLLKNMDPDDWLQYLRSIVEGSNTAAKDLAGKLLYQFRERDLQNAPSISSLTPREKEILLLVSKGLTNKQMAEQLFISENTVKNHMKNLLEKLNLENRVQLASYALKNITK
ncbi:response regulator transcription factor [Neobacillus sp. OS1-33]|jgi:two-component system, NarL family, nitrate/nitrite response regulator NarL|uniref:response regulator transcription factor n=1 Tax=Neobacillus sp. OS1-33 TaxID=3070683 RepID=UPI0027DFEAF6|nr:response regulator transcription factor [Neobacillus sp. OS1-33]WML24590.1 response regulator transcription factor [Neobacillus sp. OS1-33]